MPRQENLENTDNSAETSAQAKMSGELRQMAANLDCQPLSHEGEHKKTHQEEERAELLEMEKRANSVGGRVGERAMSLIKKAKAGGMGSLPQPGDLVGMLNDLEGRKKFYDGWSADDLRQLYEVLNDVDMSGNFSFEESQKMREEFKEHQKQEEERLKKIREERQAEELRRQEEDRKFDEQQKKIEETEKEETIEMVVERDNKKISFFDRLRKWAAPVVLLMGGAIAAPGAKAGEGKTPEAAPRAVAEQVVESEAQIKLQKDKAFLRDSFQKISGGLIAKTEGGNLALQAGGQCYEIQQPGLQELMEISSRHRVGLEQLKNNIDLAKTTREKENAQKIYTEMQQKSSDFIKAKIIGDKEHTGLGRVMRQDELPEILKKYEASKAETIKEMNEGPIIQNYK